MTFAPSMSMNGDALCIQRLRADLEDREARLRAQKEEMKQRDAEISRLLGKRLPGPVTETAG